VKLVGSSHSRCLWFLFPISHFPLKTAFCACTQSHGQNHSCFSISISISWPLVIWSPDDIYTHTCCWDTSGVGGTCKRATYWNSSMHVTICSIIHSTINNEYEDSVLLCCRYCTIAFIVWFRAVPILYFFSLPLLHHDSSHPLFLRSAITCISKAVLIHGVRKAITEGDSENKQVTFSSSLEIDAHFSLTTWESDLSYFLTLHFINRWVIQSFGVVGIHHSRKKKRRRKKAPFGLHSQQEFPYTLGSVWSTVYF